MQRTPNPNNFVLQLLLQLIGRIHDERQEIEPA